MFAHFVRRPGLTVVGALALVIATASPGAAAPGDPDPTFDGDGRVTTDFLSGLDEGNGVAIQANGKIVAAGGAVLDSGPSDFALARYHENGALDTTFGGDGRVTTDFRVDTDEARGVAIQADGKIVAAGFAFVSGTFDFALARYNTDGSLDTTFDTDGKVTTDFVGNNDQAHAVAIQGDGKIVAAGFASVFGTDRFALARYNTDGSLDTTFGGVSQVITDFGGFSDRAFAVAIQGDGKIVAGGVTDVPAATREDFAIARYNTDGSLDPTFDGDGKVTTDFLGGSDEARAVAIQADGRMVAAGWARLPHTASDRDFALARYNSDGSLDTTFDTDGKVITDFAGAEDNDQADGIAIQTNGKIVAAGCAGTGCGCPACGSASLFALARYNANGSLDAGFSEDGKVVTDFFGGSDEARAVAIQADGKIVAAGCTGCFSTASDFALARYAGGNSCHRTSRRSSIPICS